MLDFEEVEEEKREATKKYSEQLKELRNKMRTLSSVIREKKELRIIDCDVRFHSPIVGRKQTVRLDTNTTPIQ
jgi:DNA-binding GntR family transcriptional regulator